MIAQPIVYVVDDDPAILRLVAELAKAMGLNVESYPSAREFLEVYQDSRPGCLVLDVRVPGTSGLELQKQLALAGSTLPIIFITGHADVRMAVEAMEHGAFAFLEKPFRPQELCEKIQTAVQRDVEVWQQRTEQESAAARLAQLTPAERRVADGVAVGKTNKMIAQELGLSARTIEGHRRRLMQETWHYLPYRVGRADGSCKQVTSKEVHVSGHQSGQTGGLAHDQRNLAGRLRAIQWSLLALFGVAAISLAAGGYRYWRHEVQAIRKDKYGQLKAVADLKVGQIVAWREERLADARFNSTRESLRAAVTQADQALSDPSLRSAIQEDLNSVRKHFGYDDVILVGTDGRILLSLNPRLTVLETNAKELVARAISSQEAVFDDFFPLPDLQLRPPRRGSPDSRWGQPPSRRAHSSVCLPSSTCTHLSSPGLRPARRQRPCWCARTVKMCCS